MVFLLKIYTKNEDGSPEPKFLNRDMIWLILISTVVKSLSWDLIRKFITVENKDYSQICLRIWAQALSLKRQTSLTDKVCSVWPKYKGTYHDFYRISPWYILYEMMGENQQARRTCLNKQLSPNKRHWVINLKVYSKMRSYYWLILLIFHRGACHRIPLQK